MTHTERRAFSIRPKTPEQREVARMRHPLLAHYRSEMTTELRQSGLTDRQCEQQIDLRMMLHTDPRIARMATPTMKLSEGAVRRILEETRGLL
ncbi:hypothetical protein CSV61_16100 [Sporosarcina sp. P3]|uniref:hypothetical protein n=1 Tax=Sporosarcina sp. P3 TaxID=2048245 RepID=UPI000C1731C9|nr:hypothetical protein [Sporosarcina sp. P3]PID20170.1 hypothetical protein CSV61_16100 [Sporosarcina sp. P3]